VERSLARVAAFDIGGPLLNAVRAVDPRGEVAELAHETLRTAVDVHAEVGREARGMRS